MKAKRSLAWEKSCIETLVNHLHPNGDILEIGFDLGYFAEHIQLIKPKKHIIIESDPKLAQNAKTWAQKHQGVEVIEDTWQNALAKLGSFNLIFLNDFHPEREEKRKQSLDKGISVIDKGQELISKITKQFPELTSHRYSDSDIDSFYNEQGKSHPKEFSHFLHELQENKQISKEQYETMLKKYSLEKKEKTPQKLPPLADPTFPVLETCLKNHMKKGSRFACFSSWPLSKFESPLFFEKVITDAYLEYQEKILSSEDEDPYHALTFVVEKLS